MNVPQCYSTQTLPVLFHLTGNVLRAMSITVSLISIIYIFFYM
jgi:hypothetical protein